MASRHQIAEPVGVDGAWRLYRAIHRERGTEHGLAVRTEVDPAGIERMEPLISAQRGRLDPAVVAASGFGGSAARLWVASPWLDGVLLPLGVADPAEAAAIVTAAARALVAARARGVPHGALGPGAVLVDAAPEGLAVRVARFGLAAADGPVPADADERGFERLVRQLDQPAGSIEAWAAREAAPARGPLWARVPELRHSFALDQEVAASLVFGSGLA